MAVPKKTGHGHRANGARRGPTLPSSLAAELGSSVPPARDRQRRRTIDKRTWQSGSHKASEDLQRRHPRVQDRITYEGESPSGPSTRQSASRSKNRLTPRSNDDSVRPTKTKKRKLPEITLPESAEDSRDDAEIEWLEYMLKKKQKGEGGGDDLDDGLDDLLDFADIIGPGGDGLKPGQDDVSMSDGSEDEDDFDMEDEDEDEDEDGDEDEDEDGDEDEDEDGDEDGNENEDGVGYEGISLSENEESEAESVNAPEGEEQQTPDISSAADMDSEKVSKNEASVAGVTVAVDSDPTPASGRYLPPHLRAAKLGEQAETDKERQEQKLKLDRRVQGLLNKLSEANIAGILGEVEGLYRDYPRNSVSTSITDTIIQMISSRANLLDSFVALYATFVGAIYRVIGLEFGAHFTQALVSRYRSLRANPSKTTDAPTANIYETPDASKESLNLLTLIAELYNAGVVASNLIYDLVRELLATEAGDGVIGETQVEGLLKLMKCCGRRLRTDDPASMKDIVAIVQEQNKGKESQLTTRARFMIETLVNIKDGKSKASKNPSDSSERMNKFLSSLNRSHHVIGSAPLRVSLVDLLSADKRGKWWLVGAGWSGDPLAERQAATQGKDKVSSTPAKRKGVDNDEEAVLALARAQGMNTEIRRNVFLILMTSEDYTHAVDRMTALRYTPVQQREFIRVTLHCCSVEKTYNPYHTLVLNHLCSESHDHRFTLQYALWDFVRSLPDLGKTAKRNGRNVAKGIAYIIAQGHIDLTVLKGIDFTTLDKVTSTFLVTTALYAILGSQTLSPLFGLPKSFTTAKFDAQAVQDIFERALSNVEVAQGLSVVLRRHMGKEAMTKLSDELGLSEVAQAVVARGRSVALETLKGVI